MTRILAGLLAAGLLALVFFFGSGCAITPITQKPEKVEMSYESLVKWFAEWDWKNAEATKELARTCLKSWRLNSGFIRGMLGSRFNSLPAEVVDAFDYLDELAKQPIDDIDDFELGYSLGVRVLMAWQVVLKTLEQYAPEVLPLLPALLGIG